MRFLIMAMCLCLWPTQGQTADHAKPEWSELKPYERQARWASPRLTDDNYQKWIRSIWPAEKELKWRNIRWHKKLSVAAQEAKRLQRPILLWTMNGHPCGET